MIILRYLSRELLQTTFAVTLVLMVVIMSGRFVRYLAESAAGKFDPSVLLLIMYYRLPGFIELIAPLGFMVAILMAYGRLYAEQEMTVLFSCGMSQRKLVAYTYLPAVFVALLVGLCSFWLTPSGLKKAELIIEQQKNRNDLDLMKSGQFQATKDGKLVSYTESQGPNKELRQVFISSTGVAKGEQVITIKSGSAERINNSDFQQQYLLFKDGFRYEGIPGEQNYRIVKFEGMAQHIQRSEFSSFTAKKITVKPTTELLGSETLAAQAELQWRFSSPLAVLTITLLGITMSYTTPRRGRYAMLFPSIIIYLLYLVFLNAARASVEESKLAPELGLWSIHALFLIFATFLFSLRAGMLKRFFRLSV